MLVIVDYGLNNVHSVHNALRQLGIRSEVSSDPETVRGAERVILPGVGSFAEGVTALGMLGLREVIGECAESGVPLLGICLGMQMLFAGSEEAGAGDGQGGLSLLPGRLVRFPRAVKVPHMGWNVVRGGGKGTVMDGLGEPHMYFAHSYYLASEGFPHAVALTEYAGTSFVSVLQCDNIHGTQFHPEKSGAPGLRVLENFVCGSGESR